MYRLQMITETNPRGDKKFWEKIKLEKFQPTHANLNPAEASQEEPLGGRGVVESQRWHPGSP